MTRFSADTRAEAVVAAPRAEIWAALTDPALVAELTPFVRRISAEGKHWHWELSGLKVLGVGVAPVFTELMVLDEPQRIEFRHDPPDGEPERAGVEGWYTYRGSTREPAWSPRSRSPSTCPLPRASGRAVTAAMSRVIDQMGDRFSKNLLTHLGAEQAA